MVAAEELAATVPAQQFRILCTKHGNVTVFFQ